MACHALSPHLWSQQEFAKLQGQPWPWNNLARWNGAASHLSSEFHPWQCPRHSLIRICRSVGRSRTVGLAKMHKNATVLTGGPLLRAPNPNVSTSLRAGCRAVLAVHHQWASHQPSATQATSVKPKILWLSVIHYIKFHLSLATYIPPRNLWMCIYIYCE